MRIFGIDPGTTKSGLVVFDTDRSCLKHFHTLHNNALELYLKTQTRQGDHVVIERVANQGRRHVGNETFQTAEWVGSFRSVSKCPVTLIPRNTVRTKIAGPRAKDREVRQAVLERFGGKKKALGTKAKPGPLHGLTGHEFQALAAAIVWWEMRNTGDRLYEKT